MALFRQVAQTWFISFCIWQIFEQKELKKDAGLFQTVYLSKQSVPGNKDVSKQAGNMSLRKQTERAAHFIPWQRR